MDGSEDICVAIVDDDESTCRSLSRLFRAAGIRSASYGSGQAFLGDPKRPRFDCLLLDVQMKGMSGIELKARLDETGAVPPVIYITAYDDPEARQQALALGCEGYYSKTTSGQELIETIRAAAARFHTSPSSVNRPGPPSQGNPTGS